MLVFHLLQRKFVQEFLLPEGLARGSVAQWLGFSASHHLVQPNSGHTTKQYLLLLRGKEIQLWRVQTDASVLLKPVIGLSPLRVPGDEYLPMMGEWSLKGN